MRANSRVDCADDMLLLLQGQNISSAEAEEAIQRLHGESSNKNLRLLLMGYYGSREQFASLYFEQMLWFIENYPYSPCCGQLGNEWHARKFSWNDIRVNVITQKWKEIIDADSTNYVILMNAAGFFARFDAAYSESLIRQARRFNPSLGAASRKLSRIYLNKALNSKDPVTESMFIKLAVSEIEFSLKGRDHLGERVGALCLLIPHAIQYGHLKESRVFAQRLSLLAKQYSSFSLWKQYASLFLAWIDFKENRKRGLEIKLRFLKKSFAKHPSHVACSRAAAMFIEDVLSAGDLDLGKRVLKIFLSGSKFDDDVSSPDRELRKEKMAYSLASLEN